jgi:pimeloyl-ACP methyl ester carboxylesterase
MVELNYKKIGKGEKTIVFLHELMGDCRNYEPIVPYLDLEKLTCYFVDLRGYGVSKDIRGEYSCDEAANDVLNLIESLQLHDIYLVAHSMSTMIAQKIALLDTDTKYIKKLILVTPISAAGIKLPPLAQQKMLDDMNANVDKIEEIVYSASKRYNETWAKKRIQTAYESSTLEARVGYMKMYLTTDFLNQVKNIHIPIKIIVGKHEFAVFGLENVSKVFHENYNDIEIFESGEAGHYPMLETPVYFASKIEELSK